MKRAKAHNSLRCPCCGEIRGPQEQQVFLKQLEAEVPARTYITLSGVWLGNAYWHDAKKGGVDWACDECMQSLRAVKGQPAKQLFYDFAPHFAYFDKTKTCRDCGLEFTFSKAEQLHWYEQLRFWVQAEKVRCGPCQQLKKQHDQFSQLMAANNFTDHEALQEIIAYYLRNKAYAKAKQFLATGRSRFAEGSVEFSRLDTLLNNVRNIEQQVRD
ncbi:zinc-ribbon domain containing protein [Hymenobacter sp. M29]|uniref:Zinc-ribbon domain containing protein n=1 Tax=Hymenobacter mellowenesis TaxID=3063995 RepID=A0ABT9A820_9BACT|nr:zinc-ribbon domain containing protein [Hymenobacter sp. M29]MDO7845994.1 zinc-ribbon domain containing protein [Hymenobacter sp. M29]